MRRRRSRNKMSHGLLKILDILKIWIINWNKRKKREKRKNKKKGRSRN